MPARVLFEDAHRLVVDKPAGVTVIPARDGAPGLQQALQAARGAKLFVVHRLDAGTSGALVFAKDAATHRTLSLAFEHGEVKKEYLALIEGAPVDGSAVIELPLVPGRKGRMRVARPDDLGGKSCRTEVVVEERLSAFTLVRCRPTTGRQHQLRVHLAATWGPLAVDPLYGARPPRTIAGVTLDRTPLHAAKLTLPGEAPLIVEALLPPELGSLLTALRLSRDGAPQPP
jgi:tRNA pseudouridine32 synthase/23S rRNA pseudouridine746 synthase